MSNTFITTLRDETLRIEVGATAASDLAVENIELSTPDLSRAVRASVIVRRAEPPRPSRNGLSMYEVCLPDAPIRALEYCAAA